MREEEERFVLAAPHSRTTFTKSRQNHWTAKRAAEVVITQPGNWRTKIAVCSATISIIKERISIEPIVTREVVDGTMKVVTATSGYDRYGTAAGPANIGGIV